MRRGIGVAMMQDLGAKGLGSVVTAGPWSSRDSFVAETAVTLDRLAAKIERLERREEALKAQVAELTEQAQQAHRLQALAESLRNSRDYKLDELVKLIRDLRHRVDAIEGPRTEFNSVTCKSLVGIDRKLAELSVAKAGGRPFSRLHISIAVMGMAVATVGAMLAGRVF